MRLLDTDTAWKQLGVQPAEGVSLVAFESDNQITNAGKSAWKKETGLLSIWILGMFNPSPSATIVVPIHAGPEAELGVKVTSDYFGEIPPERLVVKDNVIYFAADGAVPQQDRHQSPAQQGRAGQLRCRQQGADDCAVQPTGWRDRLRELAVEDAGQPVRRRRGQQLQRRPAVSPARSRSGPFYELESSSPAAALAPGKSLSHVHRTIHLVGPEDGLGRAWPAQTLGVSLAEITSGLKKP